MDLDYDTKSLMEARQLLAKMSAILMQDWMKCGCPEEWMPVLREYEEYVASVRAHGR